ncbi:GroES-like protein [Lentinula aciculospora]|uniref:GroES-like protein n=1 Tax=Lentinula aciculospora TaxID=153920 RepID=A0A9W9AVU2_9AGAR|nr:GroES-like protein [Lentinula aciculospora]
MQTATNRFQEHLGIEPTDIHPEFNHVEGTSKKALAWFGSKNVRMVAASIPDITEPDDVILQVTGTTICGSDLHLYHGEIMALQKGDILRHEFMGKVFKVGPNVKNLKLGQRVVSSFQISCGKCDYCRENLFVLLQNYMYGQRDAGSFGYSHFTGEFPRTKQNIVPDEKALYLSDVLPTSYHTVVDTGVKPGDVVGVWGLGPIGQCAARWALLEGASRVIEIDRVHSRLQFAEDKSGIETIDFSQYSDVTKRIYELCPRGLDVAPDCGTFHEPKTLTHKIQKTLMLETDVSETINEMIVSVRKMGRCGIIAVDAGFANAINVGALMEKGVRLIGNGQAPIRKYWEEIFNEYIIPGKFDPTFMITHRVPIDDLAKLYPAFRQSHR